jgi:CubicO group peptidase (beta-lactamase class C family)
VNSLPYAQPTMNALDLVAGWPVTSAAVGVAAVGATAGRGSSMGRAVGPMDDPFPWASVTKPVTALAVLIAVEEGSLALDEPAGPPGSTVRHLLAHTSGLGPEPGPPLAEPGSTRIYSNAAYLLLADMVEERTGIGFADYLSEAVLEPLSMGDTTLQPPTGEGAAAGLSGPLGDLLALGRELAVPTLISAATHDDATAVQFAGVSGVLPGFGWFDPCDWGLGVEIRGNTRPHWTSTANSPRTFGHFGRSGSFLWVDPEAGVICAGLADRPFGPWATRAWPALADAVLAEWASAQAGAGEPATDRRPAGGLA